MSKLPGHFRKQFDLKVDDILIILVSPISVAEKKELQESITMTTMEIFKNKNSPKDKVLRINAHFALNDTRFFCTTVWYCFDTPTHGFYFGDVSIQEFIDEKMWEKSIEKEKSVTDHGYYKDDEDK